MAADLRVLIVDDDPSVRASLTAYLEDEGFHPQSAGSAAAALEILSGSSIDVAIVDVRLGQMDGESLIPRASAIQPKTRFLMYTGSLDYQPLRSLREFGIGPSEVLYKPVRDLNVVVEAILRVAGKERKDVRQH